MLIDLECFEEQVDYHLTLFLNKLMKFFKMFKTL
jgi:hypothetical protein